MPDDIGVFINTKIFIKGGLGNTAERDLRWWIRQGKRYKDWWYHLMRGSPVMRLVREDAAFGGFDGYLDLPCFSMRAEVDEYHALVKDVLEVAREKNAMTAQGIDLELLSEVPRKLWKTAVLKAFTLMIHREYRWGSTNLRFRGNFVEVTCAYCEKRLLFTQYGYADLSILPEADSFLGEDDEKGISPFHKCVAMDAPSRRELFSRFMRWPRAFLCFRVQLLQITKAEIHPLAEDLYVPDVMIPRDMVVRNAYLEPEPLDPRANEPCIEMNPSKAQPTDSSYAVATVVALTLYTACGLTAARAHSWM